MARTVSRDGVLFIARREALVLSAYSDGPHYSIGFGSNSAALREGDMISVKDAFTLLKKDVAKREPFVNALFKVPIEQHQFDAVFSLYYQSGNRYAPAVAALCNAKQFSTAAELFPLCDRNLAGERLEGLKKRRLLERDIFENGVYGDLDPIPMWRGDPRTTRMEQYYLQPGDLDE